MRPVSKLAAFLTTPLRCLFMPAYRPRFLTCTFSMHLSMRTRGTPGPAKRSKEQLLLFGFWHQIKQVASSYLAFPPFIRLAVFLETKPQSISSHDSKTRRS